MTGKMMSSRKPAPSRAIGITIVVLRDPALARSPARAWARMDAARALSVSMIRAPSCPATPAMSARSESSLTPVWLASSARPAQGARPRLVQGGADPLECPAAADARGGLQRLGRPRACSALQRHQVQVAGERVPEVGSPLGGVDFGDQVRREEQGRAEGERGGGGQRPWQVAARQQHERGEDGHHGEADRAADDLAGYPRVAVLAEHGQVQTRHRQPGHRRAEPPDGGPGRGLLAVHRAQAGVEPGQRGV
jgi:hypothetical protein